MPEAQVGRLREMMRHRLTPLLHHVSIVPFPLKRSKIKRLQKGDIIILGLQKIELCVLDEEGRILAEGEYGIYKNKPSILIREIGRGHPDSIDSKKYKLLKPLLGKIDKKDLKSGAIVPLQQGMHSGILLRTDKKAIAHASLVWADHEIALHIDKVL